MQMRNAPVLPQRYRTDCLFLSDLDGDGVTDLLYIDFDRVYYWLNRSGRKRSLTRSTKRHGSWVSLP